MYKSDSAIEEDDLDAFATTVNHGLRDGRQFDAEWLRGIQILHELIEKNHSPEPKTLYRGTSLNDVLRWKKKDFIIDPAFLSTTLWRKTASKFLFPKKGNTPAILEIHCSEGTPMLSMDLDPTFGASEYEYLLLPNSRLLIIAERTITSQSWIDLVVGPQNGNQMPIKEIHYFEAILLR
ncbi:hypothetical protein IQ277_36185 [Nostocales cyanobacterium LEGE 12452]|nr:hypothetical protein [Nostocales cyanobacterium LEGE 12452]